MANAAAAAATTTADAGDTSPASSSFDSFDLASTLSMLGQTIYAQALAASSDTQKTELGRTALSYVERADAMLRRLFNLPQNPEEKVCREWKVCTFAYQTLLILCLSNAALTRRHARAIITVRHASSH